MKCRGCGFEPSYSLGIRSMFCPRCGEIFVAAPQNFTPPDEPKQATITNELRHYNTPKPLEIYIA